MDEKDYELLHALDETRNITHAADKLYMTQSALSKRIKALEQELGVEIVLRSRQGIRFTPAGSMIDGQSTVTVAVRVDGETARAISVRTALAGAPVEPGTRSVTLAGTRYNLGIARGYQSFAKPAASPVVAGVRDIALRDIGMPDLAQYAPSEGVKERPSRFQTRLELANEETKGRTRGTLEGLGEQSVDLSGAYRVTRNLDVTAGVRVSQDRDRLTPLSDGVEDSKAVYVGTQFRF